MTTPNDPTMSHDSLDAVIAGYMLAVESGDVPNRQDLLGQHPEHVDALHAFFADLDRMDRVASPLRIADELEATGASEANGHTALPTVRYFGDYELLEEIARGGMGIVYMARQVSLNRIVALKMILAGSFASNRDIQRFRSEAEAAANLDHPHIVPIYEVGEHVGRQYYSMKCVEGTSLAKHARSDPRTEVESMVGVIRAVHHAHQRGMLHRDLKPSNVLVDSQGTRLVTDFGLVKRLASCDRTFTETGQVLGTPKYMAPEQAAGRKDLTVAADVYSLGVILYERLTGQTPFAGDNAVTLLRQARESEPPRPSSIRPGLDRDLETVVLKCLEKEPGRRYPSAEAMADELDRWLRGEPIHARAVGRLEKTWLWARRNPTIAMAGSLVAAALVAVAVISSFAAVQARGWAKAERARREIAQRLEEQAVTERDSLERAIAQSSIAPLNPDRDISDFGGMLTAETDAVWQLAVHPGERVWLRFLEIGTRESFRLRQFRARSEPAMIAAVGLDWAKRDQAANLLAGRLLNPELSLKQKLDLAFIALELEEHARPDAPEYAEILSAALGAISSDADIAEFEDLLQFAERAEPVGLARKLAARIVTRPSVDLARKLAVVAHHLKPSETAKLCGPAARIIAEAIEEPVAAGGIDNERTRGLVRALSELADRLEPAEAVPLLRRSLASDKIRLFNRPLSTRLVAVAHRMNAAEAARVLASVVEESQWLEIKGELAVGLASVVSQMEPSSAAKVCGPIARILAKELRDSTSPEPSFGEPISTAFLASGLAAMASRLGRADAAEVCSPIAGDLCAKIEKNPLQSFQKITALGKISKILKPATAAKLCGRVGQALVADAERTMGWERGWFPRAMALLADRMEPAEASVLWDRLGRLMTAALEKETNAESRYQLADGAATAASRMEPTDGAGIMMKIIKQKQYFYDEHRCTWTSSLFSLARRMPPAEADEICSEAIRYSLKKQKGDHRPAAFLLPQLDPRKAREIAGPLARLVCSDEYQCHEFILESDELDWGRTSEDIRDGNCSDLEAVLSDVYRLHDPLWYAVDPRRREGPAASGNSPACRLATQELVDLLKMPTCFGEDRRVVLDHLGNRYGRRFVNHWAFVRFAQEQKLGLDFTTPPKRPDPKESLKRMLEIVSEPASSR